MTRDRSYLTIYLAVLFGCLYPFVELALEPYVSLLVAPMVKTVRHIGVTEYGTFKILSWGFWTLLWTAIPGLIFGLALGLLARSRWLRAAIVFSLSSLGTRFVCALAGEYGYSEFSSAWRLAGQWGLEGFWWNLRTPEVWLTMLGVGVFVWLGSRLYPHLQQQGQVAP